MSMSSDSNNAPFYARWIEDEHLAREAHEDLARRGAYNLFETQLESLNTFHSDLLRITQHLPSSRVFHLLVQIVMDWQRAALERQRDRAIASAGPAPSRSFESWLDEKILFDNDKEAAAALEATRIASGSSRCGTSSPT
jgi:hypothetical protein